jgi:outer membrane lipoprotein-sorting protein
VWIGGFVVSLLVLAGVVLLRIFAYSAASDRAKEDGEIRTLLNLTRRNFQRIHSVEGAWEFQPYRYPGGRSSGRFAYRAPNLFREDGVQPFQSGETTMVGNDKEMWTFSPSAWSVSKSFPPLLPRVEYTPGAIDLTAVASRYRYARLVKDDIARKLGVRVIEFGEPKDADWCDSREVPDWCLFYVDAQTGAIRRCLVPEERIYEDWITVNGATIARRVRRIYGIGEQYVYKNLRINQNLPDERVRFVPPKGAAAFPLILSRYSLRAARRYVEQHPNDAGGHALYATLLTENWFSIPQLSYPGKGERQMQAETEIKKAIDLAPDVGAYRTIYASYAFRRKDYAEAERQLKAAVNACPQAIGFWNELARFYRERKDFHAAERVLRQMTR